MPRLQAFEIGTTRGGSGRVQAEAYFPPGGAGRRAEGRLAAAGPLPGNHAEIHSVDLFRPAGGDHDHVPGPPHRELAAAAIAP